ncbi:MAG: hypothetical protein HZB24_06805 [Desulfobacterales bacterium]|nr:hypothetical protein [Desulfobacterales bacterium]
MFFFIRFSLIVYSQFDACAKKLTKDVDAQGAVLRKHAGDQTQREQGEWKNSDQLGHGISSARQRINLRGQEYAKNVPRPIKP